MAGPATIDAAGTSSKQPEPDRPQAGGGGQPAVLPLIYIGRTAESGYPSIRTASIDGKYLGPADPSVKVKAGDKVEITGDNFSKIDSVALRIGNDQYTPQNLQIFSTAISFNVPYYEERFSGGAVMAVEFLSVLDPKYSRRLSNRLIYRTKKQIEEDEKEEDKGKKSQQTAEEAAGEGKGGRRAKYGGAKADDFGDHWNLCQRR